jgi:hypothetical protein
LYEQRSQGSDEPSQKEHQNRQETQEKNQAYRQEKNHQNLNLGIQATSFTWSLFL